MSEIILLGCVPFGSAPVSISVVGNEQKENPMNNINATIIVRKQGKGFCSHFQVTAENNKTGEVRVSKWCSYLEFAEAEIGVTRFGEYADAPEGADFHKIGKGRIS